MQHTLGDSGKTALETMSKLELPKCATLWVHKNFTDEPCIFICIHKQSDEYYDFKLFDLMTSKELIVNDWRLADWHLVWYEIKTDESQL